MYKIQKRSNRAHGKLKNSNTRIKPKSRRCDYERQITLHLNSIHKSNTSEYNMNQSSERHWRLERRWNLFGGSGDWRGAEICPVVLVSLNNHGTDFLKNQVFRRIRLFEESGFFEESRFLKNRGTGFFEESGFLKNQVNII